MPASRVKSAAVVAPATLVLLCCLPPSSRAQTIPGTEGPRGASQTAPSATAPATSEHNPVFGIGPQTLWKGGMGPGLEVELSRQMNPATGETEEEVGLHGHLDYGVTQDLTVRLEVPLVQRKTETLLAPGGGQISRDATGVGDVLIRAKWRVWHAFDGSTQYHAAVVGGVKLPVASSTSEPALGSGSTDFVGGATISRDGLRYYLWASTVAKVNGEAFDRRRGNEYRYDAAVGVRPWLPSYTSLDPLFLLELNGVTQQENVVGGEELSETGGTILALAPAFWLTYRNVAFKGGVKLPFYQELGAEEMELNYATVLEVELHFGG